MNTENEAVGNRDITHTHTNHHKHKHTIAMKDTRIHILVGWSMMHEYIEGGLGEDIKHT